MPYVEQDYWRPAFKWQLVNWLVSKGIMSKPQAQRLTKKQLEAIYYQERAKSRGENGH